MSETFDLALVDLMMEHEESAFIIAYKTGVRLDLSQLLRERAAR